MQGATQPRIHFLSTCIGLFTTRLSVLKSMTMWKNNGPICINLKKMLQHLSGLMEAGFKKILLEMEARTGNMI